MFIPLCQTMAIDKSIITPLPLHWIDPVSIWRGKGALGRDLSSGLCRSSELVMECKEVDNKRAKGPSMSRSTVYPPSILWTSYIMPRTSASVKVHGILGTWQLPTTANRVRALSGLAV